MPFHVVEQFSEAKSPVSLSEDLIAVTPDFCAVIDGATSKTGRAVFRGKSSGRMAAEILYDAITRLLPAGASAVEAGALLSSAIAAFYGVHGMTEQVTLHPEYRLTASVIIFSNARSEIWFFGDCQCRFAGHTFTNGKTVDALLAGIRSDILNYLINKGHSTRALQDDDLGRKFIMEALRDQCAFQNTADTPFSYPVIDGTPLSAVKTLPVPPGSEVVLASDGYPALCDSLALTEKSLMDMNSADPLCIGRNKQTKGLSTQAKNYDDRSFLRFTT